MRLLQNTQYTSAAGGLHGADQQKSGKNIRSAAFTLQGLKRTMSELGDSLSRSARGMSQNSRTKSISGNTKFRKDNLPPTPNAQGPPLPHQSQQFSGDPIQAYYTSQGKSGQPKQASGHGGIPSAQHQNNLPGNFRKIKVG